MSGESEKVSALLSSLWSQEWSCPNCGHPFNPHATVHTCGPMTAREYLDGRSEPAVKLYRKVAHLVRDCGPVIIVPATEEVAFQTRTTFAVVDRLDDEGLFAHVVTPTRMDSTRFTKVEAVAPTVHVHRFVIRTLDELDEEVAGWLRMAYVASSA